MAPFKTAALYIFVRVEDLEKTQSWLEGITAALGIQGTLILADEGLNGTIAGLCDKIDECIRRIKEDKRFANAEVKYAEYDENPFVRMNVKIKPEIVTLGVPEMKLNPNELVGEYVEPKDWNSIIRNPEVTVLDTRNDYEYEIGTFERALNPDTKTFREFPDYVEKNLDPKVHKKIAMFCTGGIRCEKASAFMLKKGFEKVYHLKGGILKYLEEIPEGQPSQNKDICVDKTPSSPDIEETMERPRKMRKIVDPIPATNDSSSWKGQCYVFDQRVSVGHGLVPGEYTLCRGCRHPLSKTELVDLNNKPDIYQEGVFCPYCVNVLTDKQKAANWQRHHQMQLAKKNLSTHLGRPAVISE